MSCKEFDRFLVRIYENIELECSIESSECVLKSCFVEVEPGNYPPRIEFEQKKHTIYKDGKALVEDGKIAVISIHPKVVRIDDIFLKSECRYNGIAKKLIGSIKELSFREDELMIQYISLVSLSKAALVWHRIGFNFYDLKDEGIVRDLLEEYLVHIKRINDNAKLDEYLKNMRSIDMAALEDERVDFVDFIQKKHNTNIPMYIKIER